jgi:hypothetical protein
MGAAELADGRFMRINIKHSLLKVAFLVNMIVCPALIFAQEGEDAVQSEMAVGERTAQNSLSELLTEDEAIELALSRSRELGSRNTSVQISDYRFDWAGVIDNPELRISNISTRYYTDEFDELRMGLRWRPPKVGELAVKKHEAFVDWWDRKVEAVRYRQALVSKIRQDYADVITYDRLAKLAEQKASVESERLGIIEQMMDLGMRSVVYNTKARMMLAESKNDAVRAIQKQHLARRKLGKKTGLREDFALDVQELPEITQDLDRLVGIAFSNRPEIDLVNQRIELAERRKRTEFYELLPWPTFVELSYHREKQRVEDWGEFRIGINLPVFNWNYGNIKATSLAVKRKQDESDAVRERIEAEVRDAYIAYRDLLLDWKNFSRDAGRMIQDANKVIEEAKKHQTLQGDEVMEMELTVNDTEKLLCEKRRDLAYALTELYFVLGIEGPEKLNNK